MTSSTPLDPKPPWHHHRVIRVLRVVIGVAGAVIGGFVVLVAVALGHCSAFGGTCPRAAAFEPDVFGSAAIGAAMALGVPMFVHRPSRRRFVVALGAATVAALIVGFLVNAATAG